MMDQTMYLVVFLVLVAAVCAQDTDAEDPAATQPDSPKTEASYDYAKGSLCGYCEYCKFCKLCKEDCPCEVGPKKPNCHMCKYCKFCYLCSAFCDTVCQPGSILDKLSSTIVSALPSFDLQQIDSDIAGVDEWIDKKKDEL